MRLRFLVAVLVLLIGGVAWSAPIDLRDRALVVRLESRAARAQPIKRAQFQHTATSAVPGYGLFVPGAEPKDLRLNGQALDGGFVKREDGVVFLIPVSLIANGNNELSSSEALPSGSILFALRDATEAAHFSRFFADKSQLLSQPPPDPGQAKYDVISYDCSLTPSMSSSVLNSASVTMRATSLDSTLQTIVLDYDPNGFDPSTAPTTGLIVDSVDSGSTTPLLPWSVNNATKRISITLPSAVTSGTQFQTRVNYHGTPNPANIFGAPYKYGTHGPSSTAIVATLSEPYGARQWWPCKDLPDDKATTTTQRITVPSGQGWQVVSNGTLSGIINNGSSETWVWQNSYPISTYLVSLAISNYQYSSAVYTSRDNSTTMPLRCAIYPEYSGIDGNGAAGTVQVMNFYADTFGEYGFVREKYYTASFQFGGGMEHQTCTSESPGLVGDGTTMVNVHELGHQWFGDKITCRTFDHVWLNEGFATYCEALWQEHIGGSSAYHSYVNAWFVTNNTPVVGPNSDAFSSFVVYNKGGWVLHMLRHVIGDAAFFQTLRSYIANQNLAYGTAISQDFEGVAETISSRSLTQFFNQWLYRPGSAAPGTGNLFEPSAQPTYYFTGTATESGGSHLLSVNFTQTQAGTPFAMPIDIRATAANGTTLTLTANVNSSPLTVFFGTAGFAPVDIQFDPDNWVLKTMALSIRTVGLPGAAIGQPYSYSLAAQFGTPAYSWSTPGPLPAGMSLNAAGTLTGMPTIPGYFPFTATVTDSASTSRSTTLYLNVAASASVPDWKLY